MKSIILAASPNETGALVQVPPPDKISVLVLLEVKAEIHNSLWN